MIRPYLQYLGGSSPKIGANVYFWGRLPLYGFCCREEEIRGERKGGRKIVGKGER
jgi:hypothetical protein